MTHQEARQIDHDRLYAARLRLKQLNERRAPLEYIVAQQDRVDRAERALVTAEKQT